LNLFLSLPLFNYHSSTSLQPRLRGRRNIVNVNPGHSRIQWVTFLMVPIESLHPLDFFQNISTLKFNLNGLIQIVLLQWKKVKAHLINFIKLRKKPWQLQLRKKQFSISNTLLMKPGPLDLQHNLMKKNITLYKTKSFLIAFKHNTNSRQNRQNSKHYSP
jgi:hypothetical protein